jgi:hypothetical protein
MAAQSAIDVSELSGIKVELPTRQFNSRFFDAVLAALRDRGYAGEASEFENFGSTFLLGDDGALRRVRALESFGIGFEGQYDELPADLVLVKLAPPLLLPMNMCWQESAGAGVLNFTRAAMSVARASGWLQTPVPA